MSKNTSTSTKKQSNTTVAIDPQTTDRLNTFCQRLDITKKDFISMSLDFFEKTGLTPNDIDKVMFDRVMEKQMEVFQDKLNTLDQRTEQSNTIISNVHGIVMGQVGQTMKNLLEDIVREREASNQLLLEVRDERERIEELNKPKKKKGWFRRNKD